MIIVGELINASRKAITEAIRNRDVEAIQAVARQEHEAGAHYIDVNAGIFLGEEEDYMRWLVQTVQAVVDGPCSIDSPESQGHRGRAFGAQGDAHDQFHLAGIRSVQRDDSAFGRNGLSGRCPVHE